VLEANAMVAVVVEGIVLFDSNSKKGSQEEQPRDNILNWLAVEVVGIVESKSVEDMKGVFQVVDIETVLIDP